MKQTLILLLCCGFLSASYAQDSKASKLKLDPTKKTMLADVSCGTCQFGMEGSDCKLAVRIKNKAYYVDGASIDDFGDAHAKDGFCNAVRKAKVQGEVTDNNEFKVTGLQLIPSKAKKVVKKTKVK